ncbi:MAG: Asp-tRNA(Asn)/Glu-tRNA(Gln) amidotransferase subunit GatC [Actinobacteria bacterium]|nr:Asp-tRNA(Asn)/Glu-tRNA(Gln) amidotransferase subunit GatC [Actinomycetota bacterium]
MERISNKDVRHVAKLAELDFSDEEVEKITPQLDRILDHVARISAIDTEGIASTSHVMDISNVFRDDEVREPVSHEEALRNAPSESEGGFSVPKID